MPGFLRVTYTSAAMRRIGDLDASSDQQSMLAVIGHVFAEELFCQTGC